MLHGFNFTLKMIQKRPLRMSLTILQVAVGVAAVAMILSFVYAILYSGTAEKNSQIFMVEYGGKEVQEGNMVSRWSDSVFTEEIVAAVREKSAEIQGLSIVQEMWGGRIEAQGIRYMSQSLLGVEAGFAKMMNLNMVEGSFFTQADVENKERVLVISDVANKQLFGKESGVGKTVMMEQHDNLQKEWKIIGIFSTENITQGSYNRPLHCVVPYSSVYPEDMNMTYSQLLVLLTPGRITEGQNEISALIAQELEASSFQHHQKGEVLFEPAYAADQQGRQQMAKIFGLFFGSFAFVALVVSSIGILSMMLVSIVERTREIGLRRALGASKLSIVGQILSEAVCISFIGGILGIIIAAFTVKPFVEELLLKAFFNEFMGIHASLSLYPVLISLGCVVVVGLMAGLYPGIRAARFVPVEAIREG